MFKKILVPLDGSRRGEQAIPQAEALALKFKAEVVLMRILGVVPSLSGFNPDEPAPVDFPTLEKRERESVGAYLEAFRAQLAEQGIAVRTTIERGDAAQEIVDYVETEGVDLVVMSSHGRTGLARWIYGSVAEKVLHHVGCPLLLVRIKKADLKTREKVATPA